MTNDDLCNQVAIAAMQAMIAKSGANPADSQTVLQTAYAYGLAAVAVKNNIGVVPDLTTTTTAVVPALSVQSVNT